MKDLITKNEFVELLKNKYPVGNAIKSYEELPETITIDNNEYTINNVVTITNDSVESVELNYYCKAMYKFLFPYSVETNVVYAVNSFVNNYNTLKLT